MIKLRDLNSRKLLENDLHNTLKLLSPGTSLREGIDYIIQGKNGGLIVIGDTPEVLSLTEGGFRINCQYSPTRLAELAKMDGAILLSSDMKRIVRANVTLRINPSYSSNETGLRHKAAEKFSKDTGQIVLAVSRRRNTLTMYSGSHRYQFRDRTILLSGANQAFLSLSLYIKAMQSSLSSLNWAELNDSVTLDNVVTAICDCERVRRTEEELNRYKIELGTEAQSLHLVPTDLSQEIDRGMLTIKDYYIQDIYEENEVYEKIFGFDASQLTSKSEIINALGYKNEKLTGDDIIEPRGYRMLSQIPHISMKVSEQLIQHFKTLYSIRTANIDELQSVDGLGETRATAIKDSLLQMKTGTSQLSVMTLPIFE
ncbi:DNA integrity scanning diadenylate cyclase DisA [Candidatus Poribacteria bacterium]|nr:DNA integrity scanning diadenylate cyclase DisA [Candidatus Poribacteria bacterium]